MYHSTSRRLYNSIHQKCSKPLGLYSRTNFVTIDTLESSHNKDIGDPFLFINSHPKYDLKCGHSPRCPFLLSLLCLIVQVWEIVSLIISRVRRLGSNSCKREQESSVRNLKYMAYGQIFSHGFCISIWVTYFVSQWRICTEAGLAHANVLTFQIAPIVWLESLRFTRNDVS